MCTVDWNAFGTWAIASLTLLTLLYLRSYVRDTSKLASIASDQLESSQQPFVAFYFSTDPKDRTRILLKNVGSGPALNGSWIRFTANGTSGPASFSYLESHWEDPNPMVVDHSNFLEQFANSRVEMTYESLSGKRYRTIGTLVLVLETGRNKLALKFEEVTEK